MAESIIGEIPCINLTRKRGDTKSINMTLTDSANSAINITGYTFLLAVNSLEEPSDNSTEIFESVGTIVDAANGKVSFPISLANSDNVGEYFYDAQYVDTSAEKYTFITGAFFMTQDRTKS